MDVCDVAKHLSQLKAQAYKKFVTDNQLIITADTVVINNGVVLGKPINAHDARLMLKSLSGHIHQVITGVTITTIDRQVSFSVNTDVEFAELSSQEIDDYVETFMPLDKAGAYGIQEWIGCIGRNLSFICKNDCKSCKYANAIRTHQRFTPPHP